MRRFLQISGVKITGLLFTFFLWTPPLFSQEDSTYIIDEIPPVSRDTTSKESLFEEIMDTLTVHVRKVSPETKKSYEEDDGFWYGNSDLKKTRRQILEERKRGKKGKKGENETAVREKKLREPLVMKPWFQTLLWIIIVLGFTLFLILYLGSSNIGLFRKKVRKTSELEDPGEIPEDIFAINYQREIDKAVAQGNYRLAVRLQFLQLLRKLADTKMIRYTQDKTNFDYLVELQPTRFYNQFFRVTRNYEYSWYGKFPVSNDAYQTIKRDFDQLDQNLNRP